MARTGLPGIAGALLLVTMTSTATIAEEDLNGVLLRGGGSSFAAPLVSDPVGSEAYPLIALTWAMVDQRHAGPKKAAAVRAFLGWGLGEGQAAIEPLGYVRLADDLIKASRASLATVQ